MKIEDVIPANTCHFHMSEAFFAIVSSVLPLNAWAALLQIAEEMVKSSNRVPDPDVSHSICAKDWELVLH